MKLEALDRPNGQFYAPNAVVTVGGKDLLRDLYLVVSSVSVTQSVNAMTRFSFTITDAFDWEKSQFVANPKDDRIDLLELFAFGTLVKIGFGYGDTTMAKQNPMLTGMVTEISPHFSDSAAVDLTISGHDRLYPLSLGSGHHQWPDKRDSDVVSELIGSLPKDIRPTDPVKPTVDWHGTSRLQFIASLAQANRFVYYVANDRFYFGPRHSDRSPDIELPYGRGLVSFNPQASMAGQITAVEVHGWSVKDGKAIVGRAKRGDETGRDPRAKSGGDWLSSGDFKGPVLSTRAAVHDQADADRKARALLEAHAIEFITGHGESIGVPQLHPDMNITLSGLGNRFSKNYYVEDTTHTIDGNGYRTSFQVKETTL